MATRPKTGGRQKGTPNKLTGNLKQAILDAAEAAGRKVDDTVIEGEGLVAYLTQQATMNPSPFMSLLGKVLPMQVTGEGGGPIGLVIERRIVDAQDRNGEGV
jgi:hypothetical protein